LAFGGGRCLGCDNPHKVVDLYACRELAREIEQRFNLFDADKGRNRLLAHTAREATRQDGHQKKNEERQQFMGAGDGEGVKRADEEKIVSQE